MVNDVSEAMWNEIEQNPREFGYLNAKPVTPGIELFLAVDHEGYRHALLLLESFEQAFVDDRSRGLTVRGRGLEVEGQSGRPFLDIVCTDRNGHDAFNLVIAEILQRLAAGDSAADAVRLTLARWRRFWGGSPGAGLSREQVRGLFGELWFLLVWLIPHGLDNVRHWTGPTGARHDFQWPVFSVEVKTTESIRGHVHRINGLDQLDPPDNGILYLFSLRVREEASSSNSLVTAVNGIMDALSGNPILLDLFEDRLARAGYSPVQADRYSQIRFRLVGERLYRVDSGFPRLSTASFGGGLPRGVERVEYDINLETCPDLLVGRSPAEPGLDLTPRR
ncbi:PD-(D/E)XK motif protein [Desulforudis sp. 1088]|uniref:PD-(D/E)XK motif protein n=1 Tax=unclassified Candidatus Desulforudis TaxID=2635950 RepID=UPI003CE51B97